MKAVLAALLLAAPTSAGEFGKAGRGTTAAGFLKLGMGARAPALGEAYSAAVDDATALYWNPAGLVRVRGGSLSLMHATYLGESSYDSGAFAWRRGPWGLGLGGQYLHQGTVKETDANGAVVGEFAPKDASAAAGLAWEGPWLTVGLAAKAVRSTVIGSANAGAVDIGLLSRPLLDGRLRVSFVGQHLGGELKFDREGYPLPAAARTGLAFRPTPAWLITLEGVYPRDNAPYGGIGVQWSVPYGALAFDLRAGYNNRSTRDMDGGVGMAGGAGARWGRWAVDYAFVPYGGVGLTHRMSLSVGFGEGSAPTAPAAGTAERPAPKSPGAALEYSDLARLAAKRIKQGEPAEALDLARQAAALEPGLPEAHLLQGQIHYEAGDYLPAWESFEKARKTLPADDRRLVFALERLGRIAYRRGRPGAAQTLYKEAVETAEKLGVGGRVAGDAYAGLGLCQHAAGDELSGLRNMKKGVSTGAGKELRRDVDPKLRTAAKD